jgi:hypothetical protein
MLSGGGQPGFFICLQTKVCDFDATRQSVCDDFRRIPPDSPKKAATAVHFCLSLCSAPGKFAVLHVASVWWFSFQRIPYAPV